MFISLGNFPESLSQAILVGRFLVGRLGLPIPAAAPLRWLLLDAPYLTAIATRAHIHADTRAIDLQFCDVNESIA